MCTENHNGCLKISLKPNAVVLTFPIDDALVHFKLLPNVLFTHIVILSCLCVLCGQNAQRAVMESSAVRPVSVRTEADVTTLPGDAAARLDGLESAANCVSSSSLH